MTDKLNAMNNTPETLEQSITLLSADYLDDNSVKSGNKAWVAPITYDNEGNPTVMTDERKFGGDIYQLLDDAGKEIATSHDEIVVYTCGWAAPVGEDDDVAPSQHPQRVRVGLLVLVTKSGLLCSAMKKQGDEEIIIVGDEGRGLLADTIKALWS